MSSFRKAALALVVPAAIGVGEVEAQQQATTLFRLAQRADAIAIVGVDAVTLASPDLRRVSFISRETLKGTLPEAFSVIETDARCCGHALTGVLAGNTYLAFVQRTGRRLHPLGGDRGLLPARSEVVEHVRDLLRSQTANEQQRVLAQGLDSQDVRVRIDSALSLSGMARLTADPATLDCIDRCLQRELQHGSALVPALLDSVTRISGPQAAQNLVGHYLRSDKRDQQLLLADHLGRLPRDDVRTGLVVAMSTDQGSQPAKTVRKVADYLARQPHPANISLLFGMLRQADHPRTRLAAAEALLAHGVQPAQLAGELAPAVLDLAVRRRAEQKVYRYVRPERR